MTRLQNKVNHLEKIKRNVDCLYKNHKELI